MLITICFSITLLKDSLAAKGQAFLPGEVLKYEIRWSFIPAGEVSLAVLPITTMQNQHSYHFQLKAKTYPFIDTFYKVRDRIDSYTDLSVSKTLLYLKKQQEGSTNRDIRVDFDWSKKLAQYSNHGQKMEPIPIKDGTLDTLSSYYFLRNMKLNEEKNVICYLTDGKRNLPGIAKIIGNQTIETEAGQFETIIIDLDMKDVKGVFEKSRNAKIRIWVTDDHRHIMVKAKSKVVVGSFILELVSYTEGEKNTNLAKYYQ